VIAGFVSMLVAPGGSGKSALSLAEAVAMASGRELLAGEKPVRPLRVWVHNAEDDIEEMRRRLAATLSLHNLSHADLNNNLFLTSGRDLDIRFARQTREGLEIDEAVVRAVIEAAKAAAIDVIVFDPLGAMHNLPENSNEAANLLAAGLRQIAHEAGAAVVLLHHASKFAAMDMDAAGAGASRRGLSLHRRRPPCPAARPHDGD
jgi:RecA-family ATPase